MKIISDREFKTLTLIRKGRNGKFSVLRDNLQKLKTGEHLLVDVSEVYDETDRNFIEASRRLRGATSNYGTKAKEKFSVQALENDNGWVITRL